MLVSSLSLAAQPTEADLRARLVNKPLFLRGQWANDKLTFDAIGNLQGDPKRIAFTLAGVNVSGIRVSSQELTITGKRMGIVFTTDAPMRVPLDNITIKVARPPDGDFTPALDAIFADNFSQIVAQLPKYWQPYLAAHFPSSGAVDDDAPASTRGHHVLGAMSAPVLLKGAPIELSNVARALGFSGVSTVGCVIDENGTPTKLRVIKPLGLGLDDIAVSAVSKYVFKPATEDGKPVPVRLNVEVNFQTVSYR